MGERNRAEQRAKQRRGHARSERRARPGSRNERVRTRVKNPAHFLRLRAALGKKKRVDTNRIFRAREAPRPLLLQPSSAMQVSLRESPEKRRDTGKSRKGRGESGRGGGRRSKKRAWRERELTANPPIQPPPLLSNKPIFFVLCRYGTSLLFCWP
jgi:hypothetical protein